MIAFEKKIFLDKRLSALYNSHVDSRLGYRQVGKARDSESRMRWFESSYPSHANQSIAVAVLFFMRMNYHGERKK